MVTSDLRCQNPTKIIAMGGCRDLPRPFGPLPTSPRVTSPGEIKGGTPAVSPVLDRTFKVGLALKAADGVIEIIAGVLLLFITPTTIERISRAVTAYELGEDPHDRLAQYILHTTEHLSSGTTLFGAVYLLSHGLSKVVLVALVLRSKLWAYPWLIALLGVFIIYQLYVVIFVKFSWGLTALTAFDLVLVWLTWREYQAKRGHSLAPAEAGS
jgi:uncharacterized membrane protein